jgi:hypothetical protein
MVRRARFSTGAECSCLSALPRGNGIFEGGVVREAASPNPGRRIRHSQGRFLPALRNVRHTYLRWRILPLIPHPGEGLGLRPHLPSRLRVPCRRRCFWELAVGWDGESLHCGSRMCPDDRSRCHSCLPRRSRTRCTLSFNTPAAISTQPAEPGGPRLPSPSRTLSQRRTFLCGPLRKDCRVGASRA